MKFHIHWYTEVVNVFDEHGYTEIRQCRCGKTKAFTDKTAGTSGW